jgi:hypothetical protein
MATQYDICSIGTSMDYTIVTNRKNTWNFNVLSGANQPAAIIDNNGTMSSMINGTGETAINLTFPSNLTISALTYSATTTLTNGLCSNVSEDVIFTQKSHHIVQSCAVVEYDDNCLPLSGTLEITEDYIPTYKFTFESDERDNIDENFSGVMPDIEIDLVPLDKTIFNSTIYNGIMTQIVNFIEDTFLHDLNDEYNTYFTVETDENQIILGGQPVNDASNNFANIYELTIPTVGIFIFDFDIWFSS